MDQLRKTIDLLEARQSKLTQVKLPYARGGLSPVMSQGLIDLHYGKLYKGYVDRYNKNEGNKEFNCAGAYLHGIFFSQFKSPGTIKPTGHILDLITKHHSNFVKFKENFKEEALEVKGSAWIYLSKTGEIKVIRNHAIKKDIAILVDLWEHSWVSQYGTNKGKYIDSIWRILDWQKVNQRL